MMKRKSFYTNLALIFVLLASIALASCGPVTGAAGPDGPATHTVAFDPLGGSAVGSQSVTDGGAIAAPSAPTRANCVFEGWYSDVHCQTAWDFEAGTVSSDMTLYAKWANDGLAFTLISGGTAYSVAKGTANVAGSVTIPASYSALPVTAIASNGFYDCEHLTVVTLPDTITDIGHDAFHQSELLAYVNLPDNITSIGTYAFAVCNLQEVDLPDGITEIAAGAFQGNDFTSLVIPSGITTIGDYSFMMCDDLVTVSFADTLETIGLQAFQFCYDLASIVLPEGVTAIGQEAFASCSDLGSVSLPLTLTTMGTGAFSSCISLTSFVFPEGLGAIPNNALDGCQILSSVTIPSTVTSLGSYAFNHCYPLTTVVIPEAVTTIGQNCFTSCYLEVITVNALVPPTCGANFLQYCIYIDEIRVPAGSVAAYQGAARWDDYSAFIVEQ